VTKKTTILIIDDDNNLLRALGDILEMAGYVVITVNEALKSVDVTSETQPDIILLDYKMPEMNGFEVAHKLHNNEKTKDIPIIMMSGFYTVDFDILMKLVGIKRCLQKIFSPLDVIAEIELTLKNKSEEK
jgi:DNA-binding response OmpR family regulator